MESQKVNKYTRSTKKGKDIYCPLCNSSNKVYHFSWSAVTCQTCKEIINKEDFYLDKKENK